MKDRSLFSDADKKVFKVAKCDKIDSLLKKPYLQYH